MFAKHLESELRLLRQQNAVVGRCLGEEATTRLSGLDGGAEYEVALAAIAAGDLDALEQLYVGMRVLVFGVALVIVRDRATAEDVLHEAFVRIAERADQYRPGTNARAWMVTLTRNVAVDVLRRRGREQLVETAEQADRDGTGGFTCLGAMLTLDPLEREIVALYVLAGFTHREIAEHLGVPAGTVRWRYRKALRRLASTIGAQDG